MPHHDTDGLTRRRLLGLLGASTVGAFGGRAVHPLVPLQPGEEADGWRPRFFDAERVELVAELAERIIPETDTPGARAALVHQYVDWVVSEDDEEAKRAFVVGLDWIERESRSRHGGGFLELTRAQRDELLGGLARAAEGAEGDQPETVDDSALAFFRDLKRLTIHGYYRSEAGMVRELGYEGNGYLRRFEGCRHPEHLDWQPAAAPGPDDEQER
ncbi:MAG TPA: gluconate 2-dehydrogenase subunit 3 family protein [Thermoanaerobaculia bacterium]|nr:gluconate 2-dehydrogenase subunit 3 family protein [Thermoanaerobaculia bacterium]